MKHSDYESAGVSIDRGNELVADIKSVVRDTYRPEVLAELGGFGGLFDLSATKYRRPVLVSGTDGAGTKIKLAIQLGRHDTIGIDLVAMCVNDILVQGAEPLFFLDYFACSRLDVATATDVVKGIARGCELSGCALIGGETAEMPGMYQPGDYDLAGFCVGVVEKDEIITGANVTHGDILVALPSSGPHANGFSLIRKILADSETPLTDTLEGVPFSELLLEPTRIYHEAVSALLPQVNLKAIAHITGGGLTENIPRVLPGDVHAEIDRDSWRWPALFRWLQETGNVKTTEMYRTFNCGVGMVLVVDPDEEEKTLGILRATGEAAWRLGTIRERGGRTERVKYV
ncbi:MAG: phosphoribosylformylglycinamidine cyclo-ligase [Gammaproteobacteria bacterium]|nr:phosphoribosylformylglycinamidine cyclo-ligase [Gammaproteobacteria bacterium]